jgi:hypothetical protein
VGELPARRAVNQLEETLSSISSQKGEDNDDDKDEDEDENEDQDEDEDENEDEDEDEDEADSVADDAFSPDPIDDRDLQNSLNAVKTQLQELARKIYDCPLARDPESRLRQIHQETKKLSEFKDQETRIVGFIGETGAGWCFPFSILRWTGLTSDRQELCHQLDTGPKRPRSLGMDSILCIVMKMTC